MSDAKPQPPEQISGHEVTNIGPNYYKCACGVGFVGGSWRLSYRDHLRSVAQAAQPRIQCDPSLPKGVIRVENSKGEVLATLTNVGMPAPPQPPEVPQREPMTIHNAIGLSKSIHGMCVDELPHEEIRRTVIVLAGMLHYLASLAQREDLEATARADANMRREAYEPDAQAAQPPEVPQCEDDYVAWCRFTGNNGPIVTCDSDAPGAFRVYRHPAQAQREEAPKPPQSYTDCEHPTYTEHGTVGRISRRCNHCGAELVEGKWTAPHLDILNATAAPAGTSQGLEGRDRRNRVGYPACELIEEPEHDLEEVLSKEDLHVLDGLQTTSPNLWRYIRECGQALGIVLTRERALREKLEGLAAMFIAKGDEWEDKNENVAIPCASSPTSNDYTYGYNAGVAETFRSNSKWLRFVEWGFG